MEEGFCQWSVEVMASILTSSKYNKGDYVRVTNNRDSLTSMPQEHKEMVAGRLAMVDSWQPRPGWMYDQDANQRWVLVLDYAQEQILVASRRMYRTDYETRSCRISSSTTNNMNCPVCNRKLIEEKAWTGRYVLRCSNARCKKLVRSSETPAAVQEPAGVQKPAGEK